MSGESATGEPGTGTATTRGDASERDGSVSDPQETVQTLDGFGLDIALDRGRLVTITGVVALVAVAARTAVRILANLPYDPVVASPAVRTGVAVTMPLVVALALAAVALTDDRAPVRVGLLFAAVFGSLGLLAPGATIPAVVAVAGGSGLALLGTLGRPQGDDQSGARRRWTYWSVRRRLIAGGFVTAIAVSLASAVGIVSGLRGVGSLLALVALAAVGTRAERSPLAAGAGVLAALAVVSVSATSPFVVGAALLVAFAVTGVPHALVALAVAGGVAAMVAGVQQRDHTLLTGAGLLLLAGVPATLPRAMAVALGAALVLLEWEGPERAEVVP